MHLKVKFASIKKFVLFKYILIAVLTLIAVLLLVSGVRNCLRYAPVKGKGVEVTATASGISETLDSENMEEYQVYVDYEYQGQSYTVYYKTYSTYAKAAAVDTVTLVINPDNPGEKMETLRSNIVFSIMFGLMFLATAIAATGIRQSEDEIVAHGVSREAIRSELMTQIRHRRGAAWLLTVGIGLIVFWIIFRNTLSPLLAVAGLILLILGIRLSVRDIKDMNAAKNGEFHLRRDLFAEKYIDSDSDSTSYQFVYGSDPDSWETSVTYEEYQNASSDEEALSILLESRKEAVFRYRKTESGWLRCSFSNPHRNGH